MRERKRKREGEEEEGEKKRRKEEVEEKREQEEKERKKQNIFETLKELQNYTLSYEDIKGKQFTEKIDEILKKCGCLKQLSLVLNDEWEEETRNILPYLSCVSHTEDCINYGYVASVCERGSEWLLKRGDFSLPFKFHDVSDDGGHECELTRLEIDGHPLLKNNIEEVILLKELKLQKELVKIAGDFEREFNAPKEVLADILRGCLQSDFVDGETGEEALGYNPYEDEEEEEEDGENIKGAE